MDFDRKQQTTDRKERIWIEQSDTAEIDEECALHVGDRAAVEAEHTLLPHDSSRRLPDTRVPETRLSQC